MNELFRSSDYLEWENTDPVTNVVVMYPDVRTTGGIPLNSDELKNTFVGKFYTTVEKILTRQKRNGAYITAVVYSDTLPNNFSPLFPFQSFDTIVPVLADFSSWNHQEHIDMLDQVVSKLDVRGTTMVGGYHAFDCVVTMAQVLQRRGHTVQPNLLLTNELGPLLVTHRVRNNLRSLYTTYDRQSDRENWEYKYEEFSKLINDRGLNE